MHLPLLPDYKICWCKRNVEKWDVDSHEGNLSKKGGETLCVTLWEVELLFIRRSSRQSSLSCADQHAFLHGDHFHGEPVVRRDGWLHLHHAGGHRGVQREDAAGQGSVQWLWERGGKWCEAAAAETWGWLCVTVTFHFHLLRYDERHVHTITGRTKEGERGRKWQQSLLHCRLTWDCYGVVCFFFFNSVTISQRKYYRFIGIYSLQMKLKWFFSPPEAV